MLHPQPIFAFLSALVFLMTAAGVARFARAAATSPGANLASTGEGFSDPNAPTRKEIIKGKTMAKVSPDLAGVYDEYMSYQAQGGRGVFTPKNSLLRVIDGRVVIDAVASADVNTLQADLQALGMQGTVAAGRIVSGRLPILAIDALGALASLQFARPAYASTHTAPLSPGARQAPTPHPLQKKGGDPLKLD
jgi:hypothetical protein